jgi:HAMP domain-containing protein
VSLWWWVLIWAVLVLAALGVLAVLGLSLWRRVKLLLSELSTASDRFAEISAKMEQVAERAEEREPAVFTDPLELRQERFLAQRANNARASGKSVTQKKTGSAGRPGQRVR